MVSVIVGIAMVGMVWRFRWWTDRTRAFMATLLYTVILPIAFVSPHISPDASPSALLMNYALTVICLCVAVAGALVSITIIWPDVRRNEWEERMELGASAMAHNNTSVSSLVSSVFEGS